MIIEEFLRNNKTYTPFVKGSIKKAQEALINEEIVLYALNANVAMVHINGNLEINHLNIKNKQNGIIVLTNNRIFYCNSVLGKETFKQFLIKDITSFDDISNILGLSTLRIYSLTEMFVIDLNKKVLKEFKEVLNSIKANSNNNPVYQHKNIADELIKYKELLDSGAINKDEFEELKKKLLDK